MLQNKWMKNEKWKMKNLTLGKRKSKVLQKNYNLTEKIRCSGIPCGY